MKIDRVLFILVCWFILIGCSETTPDEEATPIVPTESADSPLPTTTPLTEATATPLQFPETIEFITIAVDVPDRTGNYVDFDSFGNVVGIDADIMDAVATLAGIEYEFIVTPFEGVDIESNLRPSLVRGEFEAAMSALLIPETPEDGIAYSDPYLEYGQVVLVRADEDDIASYEELGGTMAVAVVENSLGEQTAQTALTLPDSQILSYATERDAVQAVSDNVARAAIIDNYHATYYAERYYQRLIVLAEGTEAYWVSKPQQYGIAVSAENAPLLQLINATLPQIETRAEIAQAGLVEKGTIEKGDISLVGTPIDRMLIGVVGSVGNLDPAASDFDFINWEIKYNTMSGLLAYDADNQLVPRLAEALPEVSADGLEYTFTVRDDLLFDDTQSLTADEVKRSLSHSITSANRFLNAFLKDDNIDGFADADAIQVIGDNQIKFVLGTPNAYFASLLATPPYFIAHPLCDMNNFEPLTKCTGIGPYTITAYESGILLRLEANPNWFGDAPTMETVELRFYPTSSALREALEDGQVDITWHGLTIDDALAVSQNPQLKSWDGATILKSYMVFEQSQPPWDNPLVRQAAAYAVDREALAQTVFQNRRQPLYSPVPDGVPSYFSAEPQRSISQSVTLLNSAGYNLANTLEIDLWYISDGRYTDLEDEYAAAIKAQLEETGIFQVTLNSAPWNTYRNQMSTCQYPAFLLGWPGPTSQRYVEAMMWLGHFVFNAETVCSNYASPQMDELLLQVRQTSDNLNRQKLYGSIQELWAQEYPTLDLTQERRNAYSLDPVQTLSINALGLMRYETLAK